MGRSIVVEVRKALVDGVNERLDDDPSFRGVLCTYYWQGNDDARREQVFTANATATHESAAMRGGRNHRNEQMEFDVVVKVSLVRKPPEEADERALDIGAVIEQWVADHKSGDGLGISDLNWLEMVRFTSANLTGSQGSISELVYTVRYAARLT